MANPEDRPRERDRDERISIPLDPEEALRGLLKTPPEDEPRPQSTDAADAAHKP